MDKLADIGNRMALELQDVANDLMLEGKRCERIEALIAEWDAVVPRPSFVDGLRGVEDIMAELAAPAQ